MSTNATSPRSTPMTLPTAQRPNRVASNSTNMKETAASKKHRLQTAEDAEKYLTSKGWHPDIGPTIDSLAHTALLLATCGPPKDVTDGLRAIGLILKEAAFKLFGDAIIEDFMEKAHVVTADLVELGKKFDRQQNLALNADEFLDDSTKELKMATEALKNAAECMARTGEESRNDIDKATERLTEKIESFPEPIAATIPTQSQAPSYAEKVATHARNPTKLARNHIQARQVLLDKAPGMEAHGIASLTEAEAVTKGNEAIRLTFGDNESAEGEVKVVGAKKLRNGGVVLEMNTEAAARKVKERRLDFETNLGGTSIVKDREWATLAEYVPVKHDTKSATERNEIAMSLELDKNSLTSTRWIKPVEKRSHNQQSAHLIMRWVSPEAANEAICRGVIIRGKRCNIRKLDSEPRRCLNCQKYGVDHLAANCPSKTICGTCGGDHRSSQCYEADPAAHSCASCQAKGHASWSRDCPEFVKRRILMQNGEARYKFYVLKDIDWTWERLDGQREGRQHAEGGWHSWLDVVEEGARREGQRQRGGRQTVTRGEIGRATATEQGRGRNPFAEHHEDGWGRQAQLTGFGIEETDHAHQNPGASRFSHQ